jgi:hypothetical protein
VTSRVTDDEAITIPIFLPDHVPDSATIVDGATGDRVRVPVVGYDERYLSVDLLGDVKRFSRHTGFEIPRGGSWSPWRLAGRDLRLWRVG